MTTAATMTGAFSMRRVLRLAFGAVECNVGKLLVLAVIMVGIPAATLAWVQQTFLSYVGAGAPSVATAVVNLAGGLVLGLVQFAITAAAEAAILHLLVRGLVGRKATLGEAFSAGLVHWWPVLLVSTCIATMTGLGLLAFVIPGIMVLACWCVAVPAQVLEGRGVLKSLARSAELTSGRRWRIVLFFATIAAAWVLVVELVRIAVFVWPTVTFIADTGVPTGRVILAPILAVLTTALSCALMAALFVELCSTREG